MSFDISKFDTRNKSEAGVEMKIFSPVTGKPFTDSDGKEITITLRGRNSRQYKDAQRVVVERRIERQARGVNSTPADLQQDDADILAACTVTWTFTEMDGQPFPPTPENATQFWHSERFPWIVDQASRFIANDGNFLET